MKKKIKNIGILTTSRSDFGLLKNLIINLKKAKYNVKIFAAGSHFVKFYGNTQNEIKESNLKIFKSFNVLKKNKISSIDFLIGKYVINSSNFLKKKNIDLIFILGDRYEAFSIAISSYVKNIPIAHLHGGEVTQGSLDDSFRHCITKLSSIHFVSNETYKRRVIQLGENPENIIISGALAIESIKKKFFFKKKELEKKLNVKFNEKIFVITIHPETKTTEQLKKNLAVFFSSLKKFIKKKITLIFTAPGADINSHIIITHIKKFIKVNKNSYYLKSLGQKNYYSLLNLSDVIIGNSSSGIIEMPYFNKPTLNIGNRQSGRIMDKSVINVKWNKNVIEKNIENILYRQKKIKNNFIYGKGDASKIIINSIKKLDLTKLVIKKFYDLK